MKVQCAFGVDHCGTSPRYSDPNYWTPTIEVDAESHEHGHPGDDLLAHLWAYRVAAPGSRDNLWVCCDCHDMLAEFGEILYPISELPV